MMMMIGAAQRVAHRRQRRPPIADATRVQTRYPGFDLVADPSGFYKVGHIYKDGPADRDYLKIKTGDYIIARRRPRSEDDRQLLAATSRSRAGSKFHFLVNDKPAKDGAWDVDDHAGRGRRVRRSAVRAVGRRSPRDGRRS